MYGLYLDCKNTLSRSICEKLYLNSTFSDINFLFTTNTGDVEEVPAHKLILATASSAFCDMFYGHLKREDDDIPIIDATIEAFREFLQFFYLDEVRLTPTNIVQVTNLCKKFKLTECIVACADLLQRTLTIDDVCWTYGIALSLKQPSLVQICEEKLKDTTIEVFESESFLDCDLELLDRIINLVSSECSAIEIVNACMRWSKAQCKRLNMLRTPKNMRDSLSHLFDEMPFEKLTLEQLSQYTCSYKKIFTGKELKIITQKIITKNLAAKQLAEQRIKEKRLERERSRVLNCDRRLPGELVPMQNYGGDIFTAFSANKQIVLKEFYARIHGIAISDGAISYDINVNQYNISEKIVSGRANISKGSDQIHIVLPKPVTIDAAKIYTVNIYTWNIDCIEYFEDTHWQPLLRHKIQANDIAISFKTNVYFDSDTISRLVFIRPTIETLDDRDWAIVDPSINTSTESLNEETISR